MALAEELGVSQRTVYRDIGTLVGEGADIEGEAGLGYVLRPGFVLPPLMFRDDEIEALILGLRFVARRGDDSLAEAAENAAAKILAVLPTDLREMAETSGLLAGPEARSDSHVDVAILREAIRAERKLQIDYRDLSGSDTRRITWPVSMGFFNKAEVLAAWCETRQAFRHFRTDRILAVELLTERYPARRAVLLKQWKELEGVSTQF